MSQLHRFNPVSQTSLMDRSVDQMQLSHQPFRGAIAPITGSRLTGVTLTGITLTGVTLAGISVAPTVVRAQMLGQEPAASNQYADQYAETGVLTAQSSSSLLDQPLSNVSDEQFSHFGTLVIVAGLAAWIITMCKDG